MNRTYIILAVVLLAAMAAVVWAAQGPPDIQGQQGMQDMQGGRMGMGGMAAVAASGNSVYVVSHGMLMKYDAELRLEKQVELPMPERGMGGGRGGRGGGGGGRGGRGGGGMMQ